MAHAKTGYARGNDLMVHDLVTANGVPADRARAAEVAAAPRSGRSARSVVWTALVVDVVMVAAAVVTAKLLTGAGREPFFWFVAFGGLTLMFLYKKGLYDWRVRVQVLDDLRGVVTVTLLAITTILSLRRRRAVAACVGVGGGVPRCRARRPRMVVAPGSSRGR